MLTIIAIYLLATAALQLINSPRRIAKAAAEGQTTLRAVASASLVIVVGLKVWFGIYLLTI